MNRRGKKIGKVARLAASEERRYSEMAGRAQRSVDEQRSRLGELNAYRLNYSGDSPTPANVSAAHLKDYQSFLSRLDKAIEAQQQIVRDSEQRAQVHRQRWLHKRQRLESLERVLEKCEADHATHEARREQKRLDELAKTSSTAFDNLDD